MAKKMKAVLAILELILMDILKIKAKGKNKITGIITLKFNSFRVGLVV